MDSGGGGQVRKEGGLPCQEGAIPSNEENSAHTSSLLPPSLPPSLPHSPHVSTPPHTSRYCELYAALCTARPALLEGLASALPGCSADPASTSALLAAAATLARALGAGSPELVQLVVQHPAGSEPLVLSMVEAVVDGGGLPTVQLLAACRGWYARCEDVKVRGRGGDGRGR